MSRTIHPETVRKVGPYPEMSDTFRCAGRDSLPGRVVPAVGAGWGIPRRTGAAGRSGRGRRDIIEGKRVPCRCGGTFPVPDQRGRRDGSSRTQSPRRSRGRRTGPRVGRGTGPGLRHDRRSPHGPRRPRRARRHVLPLLLDRLPRPVPGRPGPLPPRVADFGAARACPSCVVPRPFPDRAAAGDDRRAAVGAGRRSGRGGGPCLRHARQPGRAAGRVVRSRRQHVSLLLARLPGEIPGRSRDVPGRRLPALGRGDGRTRPGRPPARAAERKQYWTCPMCPEVREDRPVPCPSCGMALEPPWAAPSPAPATPARCTRRSSGTSRATARSAAWRWSR